MGFAVLIRRGFWWMGKAFLIVGGLSQVKKTIVPRVKKRAKGKAADNQTLLDIRKGIEVIEKKQRTTCPQCGLELVPAIQSDGSKMFLIWPGFRVWVDVDPNKTAKTGCKEVSIMTGWHDHSEHCEWFPL